MNHADRIRHVQNINTILLVGKSNKRILRLLPLGIDRLDTGRVIVFNGIDSFGHRIIVKLAVVPLPQNLL